MGIGALLIWDEYESNSQLVESCMRKNTFFFSFFFLENTTNVKCLEVVKKKYPIGYWR